MPNAPVATLAVAWRSSIDAQHDMRCGCAVWRLFSDAWPQHVLTRGLLLFVLFVFCAPCVRALVLVCASTVSVGKKYKYVTFQINAEKTLVTVCSCCF